MRITTLLPLVFFLMTVVSAQTAQFVEVNAEVNTRRWSEEVIVNIPIRARCVLGTNQWLMEVVRNDFKQAWWFTGTNVVYQTVTLGGTHPDNVGMTRTYVHEQGDDRLWTLPGAGQGYPNPLDYPIWLAFCSGRYLQTPGRKVPIPVQMGWLTNVSDATKVFRDPLGLPYSIDLFGTDGQALLQYRVVAPSFVAPPVWDSEAGTNVLGWTIPLSFEMVDFMVRSNRVSVRRTVSGKVLSVRPSAPPSLPVPIDARRDKAGS